MSHVDKGALHAYLDGALDEYPAAEANRIREHLDGCAECADWLEGERSVRADAMAMLSMAAPEVDMPSFEELRAYVNRTRAERPATTRLHRMGWAASVVLAIGAGWMMRGGQLQQVQLMDTEDRLAPAAEGLVATQSVAASSEMEASEVDGVAAFSDTRDASSGGGARANEASAPPTRQALRSEVMQRADLPSDVVAKTSRDADEALNEVLNEELARPDESSSGPEAQLPPAPVSRAVSGMAGIDDGVAKSEVASAFREMAEEAPVPAVEPDASAPSRVADDLAMGREQIVASAAGAPAEPEEEPDDVAERSRGESRGAFTSAIDRNTGFVNQPVEESERDRAFDAEPSLVVPGYDVLSITNMGEGTTFIGVQVRQSLDSERTLEIFHLEPEVGLDVLPSVEPGITEVRIEAITGWIVMRGPLSEGELNVLLASLFPEG